MIIIDKPIIKALEDKTALIANVTIDGKQKELFFKVDNEFASYLTYEVGDAFVIGLLHRAMQMGHDIVSRAPVSENLLYGITKFLIPNLLMGDKNCGLCLKCRRTMLQLYILGKLNNFKDVFPVDYFYSHISEYIDWMIDNKSSSNLERETYQAYVDKFGVPNHSKQRFLKCLFYKK